MFRLLVYIFLGYLAYQFIFHFVLPIYRTTQQVRKKFEEMSTGINEADTVHQSRNAEQKSPPHSQNSPHSDRSENKPVGEYIDFEEVK